MVTTIGTLVNPNHVKSVDIINNNDIVDIKFYDNRLDVIGIIKDVKKIKIDNEKYIEAIELTIKTNLSTDSFVSINAIKKSIDMRITQLIKNDEEFQNREPGNK